MSKVYFIGAGPGDPELITVKGQRLIREADLVLYAGSLVPRGIVEQAREGAKVVDSAPLNLDETHALLVECVRSGGVAARVHTGDPGLYGAVREQARLLDREGIAYEVVPGVTSASAAAAAANVSFTVPNNTQTLILTRMEGRTPVPERESIRNLAKRRASMAVYLSASDPERLQSELAAGGLEPETPVVIGYRIGWPEQKVVHTVLGSLAEVTRAEGLTRQTIFLILPGEDNEEHYSKLYDPAFTHGFREGGE